jgi:hypothetical protein
MAGALQAKDEKINKNIKLQKEETKTDSSNIAEKIKPEVGAKGSFIVPFGKPAPYLGFGYGASLHFDLMPYEYKLFNLRVGISSEFMYFTKKTSMMSATLMIFPEYAHVRFGIQLENGFLAYVKLGGGLGIALLDKTEYKIIKVKNTAYDPIFAAGLGIGYNPPMAKNLVIFAEADYKMIFESVQGQFLTASLGAAYRY